MPDLLAKRCNKDLAVLLPLRHRKSSKNFEERELTAIYQSGHNHSGQVRSV